LPVPKLPFLDDSLRGRAVRRDGGTHVSNQDEQGDLRGTTGAPADLETQLAKEREARALMRDRLRNTEALAAESHALRARMAEELDRVTAERDRLRVEAAAAAAVAESIGPATAAAASDSAEPMLGPATPAPIPPRPATTRPLPPPRPNEWSTRPPKTGARRGPWRALGLLAGLAAAAAGFAWITGAMPLNGDMITAAFTPAAPSASTPSATTEAPSTPAPSVATASAERNPAASNAADVLDRAASAVAASRRETLAAASASASSSPEATLSAAPTAAGTPPAVDLPARLRAALDAEGVLAPVEVDARTGHVAVSDPAADNATRERTDMLIRAVYVGASLPEPLIEHRWVSAPRAGRVASAAPVAPAPVVVATAPAPVTHAPARHETAPTADHGRHAAELTAAADEPRVILPMGRITASCKEVVAGTSTQHRASEMSTCMRHSCCSSANRQTEECRAFDKSYPLTCSAR
jgi:hypothetical protein